MRLIKENVFTNCIAKVKKWVSGISIKSILGKIENFFYDDEYYDEDEFYEEEFEEAKAAIYHLLVYDVSEYQFVLTLLSEGYTVITNVEMLSEYQKEMFRKHLQIELFKQGIYCHKVNSSVFLTAPKSVEVTDFEEKEKSKGKILYLSDYRNNLKKK